LAARSTKSWPGKGRLRARLSAFARYSYTDHVPFLARNFGSFGVQFNYELFDGGRRRAAVSQSNVRLAQARENLARVTDEVELSVETAANSVVLSNHIISSLPP
jgi:outer membrane protein TolC